MEGFVWQSRSLLGATEFCDKKDQDERPDFAESLDELNNFSIALGVFLWLAGMLALVPQHIKMWRTKNSAGLSFYMLFLSNICQFSAVLNAFILKFPQFQACFETGILDCTPKFKTDPKQMDRDWLIARALFIGFIFYALIMSGIGILMLWVFGECGSPTLNYGWGVGILATAVTFIQWSPQIWKTWKLKAVGAFSILTLAIQAPGTMVVVYFLLFVASEDQLVLLALLLYFEFWYSRRHGKKAVALSEEETMPISIQTTKDVEGRGTDEDTARETENEGEIAKGKEERVDRYSGL
ncbi:PQ loop repeat-containing protein [Acanthamoeba castellanii str. Neff]|uniref:PQ loop repeat-containing protein n=1 Tax=Acanthamoeba castellanii (strain ATCC 30010 / Neff) TaxID=1257118 RepID=L8GS71_ACACF|nr:PQ loop repeat-containing protein [Acanthamoeba castellanii str. Neff]ELR14976.1 PQ loop repeat-containing protein [Acanthamoeba castellanii str. Neff]